MARSKMNIVSVIAVAVVILAGSLLVLFRKRWQTVKRGTPLVLALAWLLPLVGAAAPREAENVALAGLEAVNRNDGARFITVAHPALIHKIREMIIAPAEAGAKPGTSAPDLNDYGVTTLA